MRTKPFIPRRSFRVLDYIDLVREAGEYVDEHVVSDFERDTLEWADQRVWVDSPYIDNPTLMIDYTYEEVNDRIPMTVENNFIVHLGEVRLDKELAACG